MRARAARQNLATIPKTRSKARPGGRQKLFVVVPAYNEALNLVRVIREVQSLSLGGFDTDLVVVDDGSVDRTRDVALSMGAPVISLPYNMGIGMSVQTGFRYALAHGADFVAQVDGDGQHVAGELSKLFPELLAGHADVAVGTRFAPGQRDGLRSTTFLRWFAGRALAWTVRLLTGQRLTDTTSGFRLFNRAAAELVAGDYPDDYPEVQVLVALARHSFRIVETPVQMRSREHGTSSINWWRSAYYIVKVMFASFMDRIRR